MPACTSTSDSVKQLTLVNFLCVRTDTFSMSRSFVRAAALISLGVALVLNSAPGMAIPANATDFEGGEADGTQKPESESFSDTPYTEYGEFNEDEDEQEITEFFQSGRFFGASIGSGLHGVTGNRGRLWRGGLPLIDVRVHVWLTLNVSLNLSFYNARHTYVDGASQVNVAMFRIGGDIRYTFDTENLPAPWNFAKPYIIGGGGSYSKNELNPLVSDQPATDSGIGINIGAGLEFPIVHRKVYLTTEFNFHLVGFNDAANTNFQSRNIPDLSGNFYTIAGSLLFTW
jgi:hypothetical protein